MGTKSIEKIIKSWNYWGIWYNKFKNSKEVIKIGASIEIKKALAEKEMDVKDLAILLECTPENLYLKFKRNNWKESDINKIADALGYEYLQQFVKR